MYDIGAFLHDNAMKRPQCPHVRKWRCMPVFFVLVKAAYSLNCSTNTVYAHAVVALEFRQTILPERNHSHIVSSLDKLNAEIVYMALFPTNHGRIGLSKQ